MITEQKTLPLAIDAHVEIRLGKQPWHRLRVPEAGVKGANQKEFVASVPHAVEVGRSFWAGYIQSYTHSRYMVRVIDVNGVVAEQWPKSSMASP